MAFLASGPIASGFPYAYYALMSLFGPVSSQIPEEKWNFIKKKTTFRYLLHTPFVLILIPFCTIFHFHSSMHNIFLVWRDTTEKLYKPQNVNRQIPKKYGVEAIADYSFKPIHWRSWDAAAAVSELLVVPESFVCCSSRQGKSLICHRPGLSAPSLRMATIASGRPRPAVPHTNIALYGQWFNRLWRHSSASTLVNLIVRSTIFAEICM